MSNWIKCHLGEIATLQRGFDLPTSSRNLGNVPIISSSGFSGTHDKAMVSAPGVVTGRYGTVGEVFFIGEDFWPLNTSLFVSNFHNNDPRFIYYLLQRVDLKKFSDKTGVPGINRNDVHKIKVLRPPIAEQKKIAEILGAWDEAIALTEKAIAAKQNLKKLLALRSFRGLTSHNSIGEIAAVKTGGTPNRSNENYWSNGTIPWMSSGEINLRYVRQTKEFITKDGLRNSNATFISKGAVMIALNGQGKTRGTVALLEIETTCNQSLAAIIPETDKLYNYFLFFYLESMYQQIRNLTGEGVRNGLNLQVIRDIRVPMPPMEYQIKVADTLKLCDSEIEVSQKLLETIKLQKRGLMQKLLTGQWRVAVESEA
jgi:type I restriction enzyme, S subunit